MKQKVYSHYCYFLTILILLPLVLSACGGSSSNHEVTASQYPYGADSISTTTADGDTYTQSFEYNSAMQVVGQIFEIIHYDNNPDSVPVIYSRIVESYTHDPTIAVAISEGEFPGPNDFGAVTSYIREQYDLDESTGELKTSPTDKEEIYYNYADFGLLLDKTIVQNGVTTEMYAYTYDDDNNITSDTETKVDDYTKTKTYSYDSHGNLISYSYTKLEGDSTVDRKTINYAHTYDDNGLVTETIVTTIVNNNNEEIEQFGYRYNDKKQLILKTKSTDAYYSDDHTVQGFLGVEEQEWVYNDQGLMITFTTETFSLDLETGTLTSHDEKIYNYAYADNGNIAMYNYEERVDTDLDGDIFEELRFAESTDFLYNDAGYLTKLTSEMNSDGNLESLESINHTLTYTDGILTENVMSISAIKEYNVYSFFYAYDDDGRLVQIASEVAFDDVEFYEVSSLTYNDNQTVTILFQRNEEEYQTTIIDFTSEGIPTGTADWLYDALVIKYPNLTDINEDMPEADINDKTYSMRVQSPKLYEFIARNRNLKIIKEP
ncbi:hypothetical protein SAMN05660420_02267 [Desulfuromusa kysingii]|uniref:YD repeat-containing protein n=1 Tax=Desulfuromusa kysingii TaxID=37625 RepID=A0A1H4BLG0_9BACT|nr:hypothetical protein [Desulfuromusa kysingii]SEA48936.1 hypothetical protein SAMN05660420_02267 [Desulfuromusa kysingii]